jgi:4-azaleucine resistance transporter AzlC
MIQERGTDGVPVLKDESSWRDWARGVAIAAPIVVGYLPIGFAFGVLADKAGLSHANTMLLSLLVYAGSSQLIAVGLFEAQVPALSIILTTFMVNLRHLLMSAALSPYLRGWRRSEIAAFAYQLTDETFAIHSTRFPGNERPGGEIFGINITAQVGWLVGTWLGIVAGRFVAEVEPLALDYALPAMFLALLVLQIKDREHVFVALLSGILSVVFYLFGVNQWNVVLATFLGATLGVMMEQWTKKQYS